MYRVFSLDLSSKIVYIKYMKTKINLITKEIYNTMTIEELNNKVDSLLAETNKKMTDLIDQYNESIEDDEDATEIDTVDLDAKFDDLAEYIEDYS